MDRSSGNLTGVAFQTDGISELSCNLFGEIPFIGSMQHYINEGRPYYKNGNKINGRYLFEIDKISRSIMYIKEK